MTFEPYSPCDMPQKNKNYLCAKRSVYCQLAAGVGAGKVCVNGLGERDASGLAGGKGGWTWGLSAPCAVYGGVFKMDPKGGSV
jgi:hypothetical protein